VTSDSLFFCLYCYGAACVIQSLLQVWKKLPNFKWIPSISLIIKYYHNQLISSCLELNITWIFKFYHWDCNWILIELLVMNLSSAIFPFYYVFRMNKQSLRGVPILFPFRRSFQCEYVKSSVMSMPRSVGWQLVVGIIPLYLVSPFTFRSFQLLLISGSFRFCLRACLRGIIVLCVWFVCAWEVH